MSEAQNQYWLIDEDGDKTKVVYVHRFCGCMVPGCVDNELQVFVDGPDHPPCRVQIPRILSFCIEGLLDNTLKVEAVHEK